MRRRLSPRDAPATTRAGAYSCTRREATCASRAQAGRRPRSSSEHADETPSRRVAACGDAYRHATLRRLRGRVRTLARDAKQHARRARKQAAARDRHLNTLTKRQAAAWRHAETLIATRRSGDYEGGCVLLHATRSNMRVARASRPPPAIVI